MSYDKRLPWLAGTVQLAIAASLLWSIFRPLSTQSSPDRDADAPSDAFALHPQDATRVRFGTNGSLLSSSLTEAVCDCYDQSCSLRLRNARLLRKSRHRFLVTAVEGSDMETLCYVLNRCKNGFPQCDTSQGSVLCSGLLFKLNIVVRRHVVRRAVKNTHTLVTVRSVGEQLYHGLSFPRGLLLNAVLLAKAVNSICSSIGGGAASAPAFATLVACSKKIRSSVVLLSDYNLTAVEGRQWELNVVQQAVRLLHFPAPELLPEGAVVESEWITVENRILFVDGDIAAMARHVLEELSKLAREQQVVTASEDVAAATPPAVYLGVVTRNRFEVRDEEYRQTFLRTLSKRVWRVPFEAEYMSRGMHEQSLLQQVRYIAAQPLVLCAEGPLATWLLFAAPESTWVMLYKFRPGYDLPVLRFHLRSWLLHRRCRLLVYSYYDYEHVVEGEAAIYAELRDRPYEPGITVVTGLDTGGVEVVRCSDTLTCGNLLDHTLLVEHRAMYENGGYP